MRLTKEQLDFFDTFGYLSFPGLFAEEIKWITEEFEQIFTEKKFPNAEWITDHDGSKRTCVIQFIDQREKLSALLDDGRILGICSSLMGEDFNYMGSDGNYYVGETGWHRDGYHPKYTHVKIAFYLDPVDGKSGALRVIPGSHRIEEKYSQQAALAAQSEQKWGIAGDQVPAQVLSVSPGDVVAFHHNLLHSAWGGGNRRRMFTLNLCQRYQEEDIDELRQYIGTWSRFWVDQGYGETMIQTADKKRMIHLEQVMSQDDHLSALSAEARQNMMEPSRG